MALRIKDINRLIELHRRIKMKNTGTPEEFSKSLEMSRTWLYKNINDLKDLGAQINYSRSNQTFYYENNFQITINVSSNNKCIININ